LKLVCELKNLPVDKIGESIMETLTVVMLTEHKDKLIKQLSGGMKRKLSLAMAIVSKPNLLILDEPTSGLDVESRKQIWELILKIKENRSIIMSSQHLEEADYLSDRLCIMTKGQLLALDTPQNIKRQFGVGYKILIEPKPEVTSQDQFVELLKSKIKPLMEDYQQHGIIENSDSTMK
jgi:ABC-type multidrug transport system ATPase subunit